MAPLRFARSFGKSYFAWRGSNNLDLCRLAGVAQYSMEPSASLKFEVIRKKDNEDLSQLSKEDLIERVEQLQSHVSQLRNIIAKSQATSSLRRGKHRVFDFNKYNTRQVALKVAYLGWDYMGYASQEETMQTIEAKLFEALLFARLIVSRETANYSRCGRTDRGVSAFGQVVGLEIRTNLLEGPGVKVREGGQAAERNGNKTTEIEYVQILNRILPAEIRVLAWCPMGGDFNARFQCRRRKYKYFFPRADLDLEAMRSAADKLLGEHDFRNMCKMSVRNGVVKYIRSIFTADIKVLDYRLGDGYEMCELTIMGYAFLWHQIRCIVALLLMVGQGKEQPEIIDELLDVEKNPQKPQYSMASEFPLVLFDCQFADVNWIYDKEAHTDNVRRLQQLWSESQTRSVILKRMLEELDATPVTSGDAPEPLPWNQAAEPQYAHMDSLLAGNRARVHQPLLERQKCETLENRIEHFTKRRKIQVTSEAPSEDT